MTKPDLVMVATMNNVLQSETVLAAAGSTGTFTPNFWSNEHAFDIPYANGATLGSPGERASHYASIEQLVESRPPDASTFVMDSWASLDLQAHGFEVRIADEWYVTKGPVARASAEMGHQVETVRGADRLAEWEVASIIGFGGIPPGDAGHIYPAVLLDDDRFTFYATRVGVEIASGVMLFRDPRCTGVYTLFTLPKYRGMGFASTLLKSVLSHVDDTMIATNPSSMSRSIFEKLGFHPVGSRRIWMRPAG